MENKILEYSRLEAEQVLEMLAVAKTGLSEKETLEQRKKFGRNEIMAEKKRTAFNIFFSQLKNPLVLILLLASAVSAFLGETVSTAIILLMIGLSAVVSSVQEYKSEKTVELLKKKTSLKAEVIRDGKIKEIFAHDLVVGDIVLLDVGEVVPADLRLTETNDLAINESLLTGEPFPVEKTAEPLYVRDYLPQTMRNIAFTGTHLEQGSAKGVVIAVGQDTEFGRTAKMLAENEEQSEFQKGISQFGFFLFKIIIVFSLVIFGLLSFLKGDWLASLLFALSIAVGISPELLPMIVTINLSQAARKMAKNSVIVKKLMAIEDLGNADVLCTDKTGTITEGKIIMRDYYDFSGNKNPLLLELMPLCNSINSGDGLARNPLDEAVNEFLTGIGAAKNDEYKIIDAIAFDFTRRRMSVIAENKKRLLISKGAAEEMLAVCAHLDNGGEKEKLEKYSNAIKEKIKKEEEKGFKILLLAYKEIAKTEKYGPEDEKDLTLLGFLVFNDPLKKTAKESLDAFRNMGVKIKLLTGDTADTAAFIARETNFATGRTVIGSELDGLGGEALKRLVDGSDIFAKITPEHKLKIVKTLKEIGHNVAFLGDGVNDAPALRAADVGISVDSGTDVAKEAADVILLKKDLSALIDGIKEGRRTFGNTLKYIFCTISSNYGNMFSVVGASVILPFIPMLPVQILLLNFLSDFPMLAVSSDNVDDEYLKKPKHWDIKVIKKFMAYFGLASSAFDFLTYGFLLLIVHAAMPLFQVGWFWQSFMTEVLIIFVVRTRKWFWQSRPSGALVASFIGAIILVLAVMYTPLAGYFGFAHMPLWINLSLVGMALGYFFAVEFGKKWFYRKYNI